MNVYSESKVKTTLVYKPGRVKRKQRDDNVSLQTSASKARAKR